MQLDHDDHSIIKILAVADIHGRESSMQRILAAYQACKPDLLVVAGDISGRGDDEHIYATLESLPVPVLAVHGNVDAEEVAAIALRYPNIRSLHLREEIVANIPFVGWGGGLSGPLIERFFPRAKNHPGEVAAVLGPDSVFVSHVPPWGILDSGFASFHGGSKMLRELIKNKKPRLMICGHIHEHRGADRLGETMVVNCSMGLRGAGAVIAFRRDGGMEVDFL